MLLGSATTVDYRFRDFSDAETRLFASEQEGGRDSSGLLGCGDYFELQQAGDVYS
jgi:hypothetical protein